MRTSQRQFPDADQLAAAATTVINQSRVTFSGNKGKVLLIWGVQVRNAAATAINSCLVQVRSVIAATYQRNGETWMDATANRQAILYVFLLVTDPPAGSWAELQLNQSASTLDVLAGAGRVLALSFPEGDGEGPLVTVAT